MTNDVATRTGLEKLGKLLPLIGNFGLAYITIEPNGLVASYTEGRVGEIPLKSGEEFTEDEIEALTLWVKNEGTLVILPHFSLSASMALNMNGILYRVEGWGPKSYMHLRFHALDYRDVEADDLKALGFNATAEQEAEEALNALSKKLYGDKVSDLDEEDHNDLRDLINKVLAGR